MQSLKQWLKTVLNAFRQSEVCTHGYPTCLEIAIFVLNAFRQSEVCTPNDSKELWEQVTLCSTPFGNQRFVHLGANISISFPAIFVLNAFRQSEVCTQFLVASVLLRSTMCSTPFGNQRFVPSNNSTNKSVEILCSTPFGNQRFVHFEEHPIFFDI